MNFDNIINQNYGTTVSTNGNLLAVGNPPSKNYTSCEGISRIGQVFLIKKNEFNSNYSVNKVLMNRIGNGTLPTYYTEQSSSLVFTASLITEQNTTCSFLVEEQGNRHIYQSSYGNSIDLSTYFLAVGDTGVTASLYPGHLYSFANVAIYKINPNYEFTPPDGITAVAKSQETSLSDFVISDDPICVITGSSANEFGKSVSITNNYLAVGAPKYNNGRGAVYIYRYSDEDCIYALEKLLTCNTTLYPRQFGFGYSISLDKANENRLVIGSNQISQSNVYLYASSSTWELTQVFSQNTSSVYYKLDDGTFQFYPSGSQIRSRYGYSVSMYDKLIAVGAPNDVIYWEYSGSNDLRQRGSVYVYSSELCDIEDSYELLTKLYGDSTTFKDNLFGYSVSTFNGKVLVGSPKPYFPFGSLFVSSSINYYDNTFDINDFGESTYCGQSLLYKISSSTITHLTSQPISKRKQLGKPFSAFGYSVGLSDENLIIGSPIPLNDDFYLSGLLITESGSMASASYRNTSSYQSENCVRASTLVYYAMEDSLTCNSGAFGGVIFVDETGDYIQAAEDIVGKAYIYDVTDLEDNYTVGNIFYSHNKLIINNDDNLLQNSTLDPTNFNNPYLSMEYQSNVSLFEKQYICTIEPGEFNTSTNPTSTTSSLFEYGVVNKDIFDFNNADIVLRYLNTKITTNHSEQWWTNLLSGDDENEILNYYTSSYTNFTGDRLTDELKNRCNSLNLDINGDGVATIQDGILLWKYFIQRLTINNYDNYINPKCKRSQYSDMVQFLNEKTGIFIKKIIKKEFFEYSFSSSLDPTGSYLAPYITTIGLYSGAELVGLAKLAQPIKNTQELPINIVVKWDS